MSALIGSTGFVGGHLQKKFKFTHKYNRSNISDIQGLNTDLLICAGLPAEKWLANNDPASDWSNMANLAQALTSVKAKRAILISTIDVYQPAHSVTEKDAPNFNGSAAYGRNRSWFETVFSHVFEDSLIIRLPGLYAENLKKNFVYDLLNNRTEQIYRVNPESQFQYYDVTTIWELIKKCDQNDISLINVATEPVYAHEIADIFNVNLNQETQKVTYDVKSEHAKFFNGAEGYLQSKEMVLNGISDLLRKVQ